MRGEKNREGIRESLRGSRGAASGMSAVMFLDAKNGSRQGVRQRPGLFMPE